MKPLPIVALIGQTNAGKSSLLNRFARQNIAIVARESGTTRDNVITPVDGRFLLIDTAGLKDPTDDFEATIQTQIADAIASADLILLTLDATKYPNQKDTSIARSALKSKKPVFLLLNKTDLAAALPDHEFLHLGIKPENTFHTSATTGQGIALLKSSILAALPRRGSSVNSAAPSAKSPCDSAESPNNSSPTHPSPGQSAENPVSISAENPTAPPNTHTKTPPPLKLALIGRPNVGKSSLFNALAKKQQALVSSRQGTTRDINRLRLNYHKRPIEILDTAGLRRPGKREVGIEKFSALRTLAAIEEADICALLIDATEPHAKLDQSLAGQITRAGKGIIVVLTKTDLLPKATPQPASTKDPKSAPQSTATENPENPPKSAKNQPPTAPKTLDEIIPSLERDLNFLPYAPLLLTSSLTGKNITKLFDLAAEIDAARHETIKTSDLNKILNDAILSHPPAGLKNTRPKPKYIVQTDTAPPWFVVHGHDLSLLHWSYKRFLKRKIRESYPFIGTPIFFSFHSDS